MHGFSRRNLYLYDIPLAIMERLQKRKSLCIDTEAMGLKLHRDRLCLIQICDEHGEVYIIHFPESTYDQSPNLKLLLENTEIFKIFHFARFDVGIIYNYLKVLCSNIACTRTMSKFARTYSDRHGLKTLSKEILGIEMNKSQQSSYWGTGFLSDSQLSYASADVLNLLSLYNSLQDILKREDRLEFALETCSLIPMVVKGDIKFFDLCSILSYDS
jgi:ribonuclease D